MDAIQFERMLSHREHAGDSCLRDMIYDFFLEYYHNEPQATQATRMFTDKLFEFMVGKDDDRISAVRRLAEGILKH